MVAGGFQHIPVLAQAVVEVLAPQRGGVYIDGTVGGGGHSALLLAAAPPGSMLLGVDQDADALQAARARLAPYEGRFRLARGNFSHLAQLAAEAGITAADGILLDIGVSSYQLDTAERGFSYMQDAPLDMRMDQSQGATAADLLNSASPAELTRILYDYGEERWAARIVDFIVESRRSQPLTHTGQLVDLIKRAVPKGARDPEQHPAKRTFQALRIAVNGELEALAAGLDSAISLLAPGGVLAVITFHSLEERIVKEKFRYHARDCVCPPELPVCQCGHQADVDLVNRKPIGADAAELAANPRSRSAHLRAVRKRDTNKTVLTGRRQA